MASISERLEIRDEALESGESINQILSNIRDIITKSPVQDNVLILTELAEEDDDLVGNEYRFDGPVSTKFASTTMQNLKGLDLLDQPAANDAFEIKDKTNAVNGALVREDVAIAAKFAIANMLESIASNMQQSTKNPIISDSTTLEDVVILLLKSELQKWLNANLEGVVKSIVEDEIQRIIPK